MLKGKMILFMLFGLLLFGAVAKDAKAADTCTPACTGQSVCVNGVCMGVSHTITNAGSSGQITNDKIPGTTTESSQIIQCGRAGQNMCTLCDLIAGMNNIIQYLMKIAIGVALLAMAIGGVMYVVSAGDSGLIDNAKSTIKNAAIGFVIIFAGYLIVNTTIDYLGSKKDVNGNVTFGMNITGWGTFNCNRSEPFSSAGAATTQSTALTTAATTATTMSGAAAVPAGCGNGGKGTCVYVGSATFMRDCPAGTSPLSGGSNCGWAEKCCIANDTLQSAH